MSQQDLNAFADWLVANQSKKGTPEYDTVANAFKELDGQLNPPDTSFGSAFQQGIDQPFENMATTARALGMEGTADTLSGATDAPVNYESATDRFMNPQEGDRTLGSFGIEYLPRTAVEQAGQFIGSMASRVGGAGLGAAGGFAVGGPAGAATGAVGGALAGPALFEFVQQLGPIALERARNNGREEPEWDDWTGAAAAAGVSGALNSVGVGGGTGAKFFNRILNRTIREGVTEGTQSVVEQVGSTAETDAGLSVDPRQAIGEGIIGGTSAGGVTAATRAATAPIRIFTGGDNTPSDPEAAADLAQRLQRLATANELNLSDIDKTSTKGAREAVDKAHVQLAEELKQISGDLRQRLRVNDTDELSVVIDKVLAAAGQREARNKTKNTVGREEFDAIDRLAGDTAEGQRMLRLMRQTNELTELHNSGYQGGLSKYTDQLMPFGTNIGYDRGAIATERLLRPLVSGGAALQTGGASLAGQAAIAGAGRAIDAVTGRRSNVRQFVKNNAGNQGVQVDPTATSLRDERRAELAAAEQQAAQEEQRRQAARARSRAMHAEVLAADAEYPSGDRISPQQIMVDELGMSPQQVVRALKTLVTDPVFGPAARSAIRSFQRGGNIEALGMLTKKLERVMAAKQPPAMRNRPIKKGGLAVYEAQEAQRSAAVAQGIRDNQALNDQLQAALRDDRSVSEADRAVGLSALEKLRRDLSSSPVQTARAILDDALNRMSDPLVASKYILPYVDRVIMQQNARATSEAPAAIEGMSAEPEINQMASSFQEGLQESLGRREALEAEAETSPVFDAWSKPNRERVINASYDRRDFNAEARRATVEAIGREARKRGLKVYHTSQGKDGRKTSRYIELPDGRRARVSDHDLPDTNQREYNRSRGIGVYDVEIIPDDWRRRSLDSYFDEMLFDEDAEPEINQMSSGPVLFNQNVFDIPDSDYAKTNLDVRPTPEQVQAMRDGTFKPEKKRTLVEAAQHLQDRFEGSANDPDPLDLTEENLERIAGMMATEGVYNIEQDGNAIGWYDRKLKAAKLVVSLVEPRIMQSPEAEQAFDFALAVTSNGQAVADNFEYALDVFRYFMDNGVMPTSTFIKGGERNASMVAAFNFFNQYNASSQETTIADFLDTDFTVRELINFIDRFNEVNGTNISVPSSEGMNEVVKGSYILGPKIGQGFYQNIRGNYDPLTMDIWWMRMWNRLTGRPFEDLKDEATMQKNRDKIERGMIDLRPIIKEQKQALKDKPDGDAKDVLQAKLQDNQEMAKVIDRALKRAGVTRTGLYKDPVKFDEFIVQLDKEYQRYYKRYKQENGVNHTKPKLFKATGTHVKNMQQQLQAQPKGPGERSAMRRATKRAIELLKSKGYDINTADFQALMWYPEKQLFRLLGVAPGRGADNDYLDAAKLLAEKEGKTYEQIQEALPAAERDGVDSGSSAFGQDGEVRTGAGADGSSQAGILYQQPIDFGSGASGDNGQLGRAPGLANSPVAGSREPTPTEVEQASRTVQAAFEIGKPGSQFENGVPDIDAAKKIAEAINVAVIVADTHGKLASRAGKALNRRIKPSDVKGSAGFFVPNVRGPAYARGVIGVNTSQSAPGYQLYTALHELGHAFETRFANTTDTDLKKVEEQIYSLNRAKFIDLDAKSKRETYANTFRDVMRQVLAVAGAGKADLQMSQQDAQDIVAEIVAMQRAGKVGGESIRQDYGSGRQLVALGAYTQGEVDSVIDRGETTYFHTPWEMAADAMGIYMHSPDVAKQEMPKTARLLQIAFRDNPTIQFFSMPFASVVAMVLANMLVAEGEEEQEDQEPGALSMMPGALTA